jgi:phosphatidylserine/phosphatidylglycerophosphate/cardiolipin synthase-like enzyme
MKKIIIFLIFLIYPIYAQSDQHIELVESIPVETTLDNPDIRNTQEVWLEMINSAKETLDIEQFYISNEKGEELDTVLNAIVAAANRGVEVRIVVDQGMYFTYPETVDLLEKVKNIRVRVFDVKSLTGGIQHAKFFIVDRKLLFIGSQNFDWRSLKHIHEIGVFIKDEGLCEFYSDIFEHDFNKVINMDKRDTMSIPSSGYSRVGLTIVPTYSSHSLSNSYKIYGRLLDDLLVLDLDSLALDIKCIGKIIQKAKNEINLQFLSYNPVTKEGYWEEVDSALISASKRGVKVKLLVSDWNLGKSAVEHFKELVSYPNFEVKYSEIPENSKGFIPFARVEHCKFITADSTCWIGTSNMSRDYFYESRNVGLVVENGKFTQRVRDIFYKSWNSEYAHSIEPNGEYAPRKRDW